jgi:hypothetical protein
LRGRVAAMSAGDAVGGTAVAGTVVAGALVAGGGAAVVAGVPHAESNMLNATNTERTKDKRFIFLLLFGYDRSELEVC